MTEAVEPPPTTLVISYYRDGSRYPRAGRPDRQDLTYWANIAVNAATLRHVADPRLRLEVHCAAPPPDEVAPSIEAAGVLLRHTPFDHAPPPGFFSRFAGSLYILDTAAELAARVGDDEVVLFVDPDIVWVADLGPLVADVVRDGLVAYDLELPIDEVRVAELTRRDEGELFAEITGAPPPSPLPPHFGGEFYGATGTSLRRLVDLLPPLWDATLARHHAGERHYNVEEHVLDAALWQLGVTEGGAGRHLARIMTLPAPFGSRQRYHPDLLAWHLPTEKTLGLRRVFEHLRRGRPLPALDDGYHEWLRRRVGIRPTLTHAARDLSRTVKWTLTGEARDARRRGQVGLGL